MSSTGDLLDQFMEVEENTFEFDVLRGHVEQGRTFSPEAITELIDNMTAFVMSRVIRRWDATNEPPTALTVKMSVEAQ